MPGKSERLTRNLSAARLAWFQRWIQEDCESSQSHVKSERETVQFAEPYPNLLASWHQWSQREMRAAAFFVKSKRSFGMAMRQLGYKKEHTSHGPLYIGLRLRHKDRTVS